MKSYALREGGISPILWTLRLAESIVERIPALDRERREVRCHELARVVAAVVRGDAAVSRRAQMGMSPPTSMPKGFTLSEYDIECNVVDGKCGPVDHTWLALRRRQWHADAKYILDPYAVGSMPQVVLHACPSVLAPIRAIYREGDRRLDVRYDVINDLLWSLSDRHDVDRYVYGEREDGLIGDGG